MNYSKIYISIIHLDRLVDSSHFSSSYLSGLNPKDLYQNHVAPSSLLLHPTIELASLGIRLFQDPYLWFRVISISFIIPIIYYGRYRTICGLPLICWGLSFAIFTVECFFQFALRSRRAKCGYSSERYVAISWDMIEPSTTPTSRCWFLTLAFLPPSLIFPHSALSLVHTEMKACLSVSLVEQ